mgnify:CR=1 FL=1
MNFSYFLENLEESLSYVDHAAQEIGYDNEEIKQLCKKSNQIEIELDDFFKEHRDELGYMSVMPVSNGVYSVDRFGDIVYSIREFAKSEDIEITVYKGSITDKDDIEKFRQIIIKYSNLLDELLNKIYEIGGEFNLDENEPY